MSKKNRVYFKNGVTVLIVSRFRRLSFLPFNFHIHWQYDWTWQYLQNVNIKFIVKENYASLSILCDSNKTLQTISCLNSYENWKRIKVHLCFIALETLNTLVLSCAKLSSSWCLSKDGLLRVWTASFLWVR